MAAAKEIAIGTVIDGHKLGGFQKMVFTLCVLLCFVEGFDANSAGYVAPALAKHFGLAHNALGLFFSAGLFGLMLGAMFVAPIADKIGRKPMLVGCLILFGASCIGMSMSTSIETLYIFRFLTGLGIGGAMPNAIAMSAEYSPARIRSLVVIITFNGFVAGSITAGLAASRMIEAFGWNSVFLLGGIMPLLLAPVIFFLLPESARFLAAKGGQDAQVAKLMRKIDPALPESGVTYINETKPETRMSVKALFTHGRARKTVLVWALVFCSLLDLFLMASWLPTQIASLGVPVGIAILLGTLLQVGGMTGMVLGWVMEKVGPSKALAGAYVIGAIGIAAIAMVGGNVPLLAISILCAGFGIIGAQTAANAVAAELYPTEIRSTGVGWYFGVGRIGSIVGPAIAGFLLSRGATNRDVFLLAVIPALIAAVAALALKQNARSADRASAH